MAQGAFGCRYKKSVVPRECQVSSGGCLGFMGKGAWPEGGLGQDWGGGGVFSVHPAGNGGLYLEGLAVFRVFKQGEDTVRFGCRKVTAAGGGVSGELDHGPCGQGSDGLPQERQWLQEGEVWVQCRQTKDGKEGTPGPQLWARWCGGDKEALGRHHGASVLPDERSASKASTWNSLLAFGLWAWVGNKQSARTAPRRRRAGWGLLACSVKTKSTAE